MEGKTNSGFAAETYHGQMTFDFDQISKESGGLAGNLPGTMVHESVHALNWGGQLYNGTLAAERIAFDMQVNFNQTLIQDAMIRGIPIAFPELRTRVTDEEICRMYHC